MSIALFHRFNTRPRTLAAAALLAVAALLWGVFFIRSHSNSAVQRHIHAGIEAISRVQGREAEREWREALRLDPNNADAWYLLAEYYESANSFPAAVDALQHLLRLRPHLPGEETRLAVCTLRTGNEPEALKCILAALKTNPDDTEALKLAGQLLGEQHDYTRQLEVLRRLARLKPDDITAQTLLAVVLVQSNLNSEATPIITHVLQLDPNNSNCLNLRAEIRMQQDTSPQGLAQSKAEFQRVALLDPKNALAHLHLGRIARRERNTTEAVRDLQEAARLMPRATEPYFELSLVYDQAGQPEKAEAARRQFAANRARIDEIQRLENIASVEPKNVEVRLQRGLLALEDDDFRVASYFLDTANRLRPNDPKIEAARLRLAALRQKIIKRILSAHAG